MGRATHAESTLVNGSAGDPVLYLDYPDRDNALLFDAGDVASMPRERIADLDAVFLTHHHADHFMDLDRVIRANLDSDKTLNVFGPAGTIQRVFDRIRSYAHSYFPFQKLVLEVNDLHENRIERAHLHYQRRFPEPTIDEIPFPRDHVIFENATVKVETAPTDHTVPCFAYAIEEKAGYRVRYERLKKTSLKPGPWISELIRGYQELAGEKDKAAQPTGRKRKERIKIDGGEFSIGELGERLLARGGGFRTVWIVDTRYGHSQVDGGLERLAKRADRLYCDCFYGDAQSKAALKHKHLTTSDVAAFAKKTHPKELVLVHFSGRYRGRYSMIAEEVRRHLAGTNIPVRYEE